jgi:leukotriene-A4 hydrolase
MLLGNASMWDDINNYGINNSYSSLFPVLNGNTPDDSFSEIPYEKGFQFLYFLESLITP